MKTKSTKRALLMSGLSLLLCMSMLVGSTFAWFTDSVTSAGNIIKSGTLDVDLVDKDGASMAGQIIEFVAADGRPQDQILWEPGCTYKTEPVRVVNKGNLALKYRIAISGIDGNAKLLEAIEWTVTIGDDETDLAGFVGELIPGQTVESGNIVLTGHMKEEAGNEYQGLTVEGIAIMVTATQLTAESDSFNNQYDKNAQYAAQTVLTDVAAVAAGETATVKLESDGYVVLNNESPVGAEVQGNVTLDLNGKTIAVKVEDGNAHKALFNIVKGGKLTVTGNGAILLTAGANNLVTAIFNNTSGELVIQNGTYKMDNASDWQVALIPTIIDTNSSAGAATTTINGGDFYHTRNMFRNFNGNAGSTLTINGGTFNGKADDWAAIWNQKPSASVPEGAGKVIVNGGEFNYVEINNEFTTGVTIGPNAITSAKASTLAELDKAIKSGVKVVDAQGANLGDFYYNAKFLDGVTVKNAKFTYFYGGDVEGTVTFEDCEFVSDHSYSANFDSGNGKVIFNNCLFDGWSSFGTAITGVEMNDCTFRKTYNYGILRFYQNAVLNGCTFEASFEGVDTNATGTVVELNNCTGINGKIFNNGSEVGTWIVDGVDISSTVTTW